MKELNNAIGALFLTNAKMTVQVETSAEMLHPEVNLPEGYVQERMRRDMIERLSRELHQKFEKEIKKEPSHFGGERHRLDLYVFTEPMFKHMVEFIISQIPEEKLQEIRSNSVNFNIKEK
jgi:hypothetical protein